MSTYDMIIQKGMKKGLRTKTIRFILNLHNNGFDIPTIVKMSEEKEEFVKDVIKGKIKA